jgi:probable F420-dependent oxidoreductase
MQFGINIGEQRQSPAGNIRASVARLFDTARRAERLGFDTVWVRDHLVFPEHVDYTRSSYPGTDSGHLPAEVLDPHMNLMDPLMQLAALAGITTRVKLGTKVLVLPLRHPLLTAKMLATLDALSGGRVIAGVGVGWLREEMEAFGAVSFEHRGSLGDEYIRIFKEVWTNPHPAFEGRWYRFSGFGFEPRPVQTPHIPIWIGGHSEAALRRVARLGDGWHPTALMPKVYAALTGRLRDLVAARGRSFDAITLAMHMELVLDVNARGAEMEYVTHPDVPVVCIGNPRQVVTAFRQYQQLGVDHISMDITLKDLRGTPEGRARAMELVATEIMPEFNSVAGSPD